MDTWVSLEGKIDFMSALVLEQGVGRSEWEDQVGKGKRSRIKGGNEVRHS